MTPHVLLMAPLAVPLTTLALCIMLARFSRLQSFVSATGSGLLLASSIALLLSVHDGTVLVTQSGSWQAPFGITLVADLFSAAMVFAVGIVAVAVLLYGLGSGYQDRQSQALFHPLYHGLLLGGSGAFLTGDVFNLYVWFEVMLISSFGLLVLKRTSEQLDAGVKYVLLNLLATGMLLMAVAFLYGTTGTLNMADLAQTIPTLENQGLVTTLAVLFLLAFGMKAALFPVFYWLPTSYPAATIPVVAIFASLLTKVGVYALFRVSTLLFGESTALLGPYIGAIAILTMVTGVLGAASHFEIRRILSIHIISQIGYMLIGLAVVTPLAVAGSIFYIIHNIIVKTNLFLVAGAMQLSGGAFELKKLGGLYRREPLLALLFLIPAMSLAGLPPSSGFWGKFVLVQACLESHDFAIGAAALIVGLLTLFSMVKIWLEAFWKASPEVPRQGDSMWRQMPAWRRWAMVFPMIVLAAITLLIGLYPEPFLEYSNRAADQLLSRDAYLDAVLGASSMASPLQTMGFKP